MSENYGTPSYTPHDAPLTIFPIVEPGVFNPETPLPTAENPRPLINQKWQTMDTAPKDGTAIIVSGYYGVQRTHVDTLGMAVKYKDGIWVRANDYGITVECYPLRWIPIPD